jgi:hypothetical protein
MPKAISFSVPEIIDLSIKYVPILDYDRIAHQDLRRASKGQSATNAVEREPSF